jgi:hypothetical protein
MALGTPHRERRTIRRFSNRRGPRAAFLVLSLVLGCRAEQRTPEGQARRFFEDLIALERAYDPALVDLYADSARIAKHRRLPDGGVQYGSSSGVDHKALLRRWLPGAAARGVHNEYSEVRYKDLGNGYVQITMRQRQLPKDFTTTVELLVGPGPDGRWLIWEDVSEAPAVTEYPR